MSDSTHSIVAVSVSSCSVCRPLARGGTSSHLSGGMLCLSDSTIAGVAEDRQCSIQTVNLQGFEQTILATLVLHFS